MQNDILNLINIIAALYFNSIAEDKSTTIVEELQQALIGIETKGEMTGIGTEEGAVEALRYTAEWMLTSQDQEFTQVNIVKRMAINLHGDSLYTGMAEEILGEELTPLTARARVNELLSGLRFERKKTKLKKLVAKANARINFSGEFIDNHSFIHELQGELEGLGTVGKEDVAGLLGKVDFSDTDALEKILLKNTESTCTEGLLNTGIQGLNMACGMPGIPRGLLVNFGALTGCYKSGMLIDICLNIPVYNDPWMWDDTKKPMILRISFENTLEQDIGIMGKKLYETKHQQPYPVDLDVAATATMLSEHFSSKGYHFGIEAYDPTNFSVYDLFDVINKQLEAGYEIHAISCDYPGLIVQNTIGDRLDSKIQKTLELIRNFCYPKGITFFSGHQLSTEAQNLARESSATVVKKVHKGGWYMDCKSLHTKLDLEFILHVHDHIDGKRYLMVHRGKHRGGESTPQAHHFFVMPFKPLGGITPDVDGEPAFLRKLPDVNDVGSLSVWDD